MVVANSVRCFDQDDRECFMSSGDLLLVLCPSRSLPDTWSCVFLGDSISHDFVAEISGHLLRDPAWFVKDANGVQWRDAQRRIVQELYDGGHFKAGGSCRMEH